jgi:hypothetical protein
MNSTIHRRKTVTQSDVGRVSNPGLLLYDPDYASAPCALLPFPSTARTGNVIHTLRLLCRSLLWMRRACQQLLEFCLGWYSKLWFHVSVSTCREVLTSRWGKIWSPMFGSLLCVIYVCTKREVSIGQYNISECCNG